MASVIQLFKSLTLTEQHEAYPAITAVYNAAKDARRLELEAEIRQLGYKPGEAAKKSVKVKYRGPNGEVWSGVGAMANWLKKLKAAGDDVEKYRVS